MIRYIISLCIFLISLSLQAQTATISGKITDSTNGDPLPGAAVVIKGTTLGTATSLQGEYMLRLFDMGEQTVEVHYIGYNRADQNITIRDGDNMIVDFQLEPQTTELGEITIRSNLEGQQKALNQQRTS